MRCTRRVLWASADGHLKLEGVTMYLLLLAIAAQLAEPQPETVTLGYEDLVALHKHADEV